mmetsp:Transcript_31878/g.83363  ORF Transcript_31878/g.83363 Transcript_31878/m.83363 type:complete len:289 (+) Transcript_31878:1571-2437(+)
MSAATFFSTRRPCRTSTSGSMSERSSGLLPTRLLREDQREDLAPPLLLDASPARAPCAPASSSSSSSSSASSSRSPKRLSRSTRSPLKTFVLAAARSSFLEKSRFCLPVGSPSHVRASLPFFGAASSSPLLPNLLLLFFPEEPPPARSLARFAAICSGVSMPSGASSSGVAVFVGELGASADAPLLLLLPPLLLPSALAALLAPPPTAQLSLLPCFVFANFLESVKDRGLLAAFALRSSSARCSSSAWIASNLGRNLAHGKASSRSSGAIDRSRLPKIARARSSSSST